MYKNVSHEEGRAFAEVKPQNVRKLFVPRNDAIKNSVSEIVKKCLARKRKDSNNDISSQLAEINKALYKYYDLSEEEVALIEKEIDY